MDIGHDDEFAMVVLLMRRGEQLVLFGFAGLCGHGLALIIEVIVIARCTGALLKCAHCCPRFRLWSSMVTFLLMDCSLMESFNPFSDGLRRKSNFSSAITHRLFTFQLVFASTLLLIHSFILFIDQTTGVSYSYKNIEVA